jgi:hypothetical protein
MESSVTGCALLEQLLDSPAQMNGDGPLVVGTDQLEDGFNLQQQLLLEAPGGLFLPESFVDVDVEQQQGHFLQTPQVFRLFCDYPDVLNCLPVQLLKLFQQLRPQLRFFLPAFVGTAVVPSEGHHFRIVIDFRCQFLQPVVEDRVGSHLAKNTVIIQCPLEVGQQSDDVFG